MTATYRAMITVCVALIFFTIAVSIYHVSHQLGQYDGRAAIILGALMGAINAVAAWAFLEVPKSRLVSVPTFLAAAIVSGWLQIRFYQAAGAPVLDSYILGSWCPFFELMLGALFAKLTENTQPNVQRRTDKPNVLNAIGLALAERIQPARGSVPVPTAPVSSVQNGDLTEVNARRTNEKEDAVERMLHYYQTNPHASYSEVGGVIGKAKSTVSAYVSELEKSGVIHRNGNGVEIIGG